jgi:NSS family neurotransmitter:Na+ symporter
MKQDHVQDELNLSNKQFKSWKVLNNIIAPIAIFAVFLFLFNVIQ